MTYLLMNSMPRQTNVTSVLFVQIFRDFPSSFCHIALTRRSSLWVPAYTTRVYYVKTTVDNYFVIKYNIMTY